MRSSVPKVLHQVAGKSMLARVLDGLLEAGFPCPTVVVGYGAEQIRAAIGERCRYLLQAEQLGTGHAARVAFDALPRETDRVLLVHGDEPLIPAGVFQQMLEAQQARGV